MLLAQAAAGILLQIASGMLFQEGNVFPSLPEGSSRDSFREADASFDTLEIKITKSTIYIWKKTIGISSALLWIHLPESFSLLLFLLGIARLSQSVLQGFTCAAASAVGAERFQELAKVMRKKKVRLGQDQVNPHLPKGLGLFSHNNPWGSGAGAALKAGEVQTL